VLSAVFGLLGVLLGGLLTGAVTWRLERLQIQHATRASARLLGDSLARVGVAAEAIRRTGKLKFLDRGSAEILLRDWEQHRERLAGSLTVEEWNAVAECIVNVRELVGMADTLPPDAELHGPPIVNVSIEKAMLALNARY
jgi:hypothetical protein